MNLEKQKLLLGYVISDPNLYAQVHSIFNPSYLDPKLKKVGTFIRDYYDAHKSIPNADQVRVETGEQLTPKTLTRAEMSYAASEVEMFCKNKAIEHAILASPKLLDEGKFGEIERRIKEAITVGLHRQLGLDYFAAPEERLRLMLSNNKPIPTGWIDIDEHLNGGLNRKEMIIFAAASGVGKSLTMSNLAKNLLEQGLNGIYITLELSEEVCAKRFDSIFSGVRQSEILKNIPEVSTQIIQHASNHGKLMIKRLPENSTNANHIRAYLKELELTHGYVPDFIVVDYLDLMTSNTAISAENLFVKDKYIAEELRSIGNDFNLLMITASQLNRSTHELSLDEIGHAQIAGGISKINTTDNMIAIIQDDVMKANKEFMFKFLKTRGSEAKGKYVKMSFDPDSLRIQCMINNMRDKLLPNLVRSPNPSRATRSILDIMKSDDDE